MKNWIESHPLCWARNPPSPRANSGFAQSLGPSQNCLWRRRVPAATTPLLLMLPSSNLSPRWNSPQHNQYGETFATLLRRSCQNLSSSTGVLHFCARNSFSSTVCCSWSLGLLRKFSFTQWLYRNLKCLIHRWDIWVGCYLTFQIQKTPPYLERIPKFPFCSRLPEQMISFAWPALNSFNTVSLLPSSMLVVSLHSNYQ